MRHKEEKIKLEFKHLDPIFHNNSVADIDEGHSTP